MQEISRRNFMKIGAAGALALATSSASATQNAKDVKFDEEYDVVVIGARWRRFRLLSAAKKCL